MDTMNLEREQADLFNLIASLDSESIEKVKKYIHRIRGKVTRQRKTSKEALAEWDEIMRPLTEKEKTERLIAAEADPIYYTQEEMRQMVASWRTID